MAFKNPTPIIQNLAPKDNPYNFKDSLSAFGNPYTDFSQGDYSGQAMVFKEPSKYGLDGGNISRLNIKYKGKPILMYDRGWDTRTGTGIAPEHKEFYDALVKALSEHGKGRTDY